MRPSSFARKLLRFCSNAARCSGARRARPSTMFWVLVGASPGSREKCGLPRGWTSPIERSTRVVGTSSTSTPREISMRPGPPRMMFWLFEPSIATSAQASRSSPFSITASARRSLSIMLGLTSASWKFCVPRVRLSTSTRSPPTASASDLRSGIVVTTRSLRATWAAVGDIAAATITATTTSALIRLITPRLLLKGVRRMRAQNERRLEEPFAPDPPTPAGAGEIEHVALRAVGVLVGEPKAQELRGIEAHVRLDRPLIAGTRRVLRRVVTRAEGPAPPRLQLSPAVPAEAVARLFLGRVEDAVAVHADSALGLANSRYALVGQTHRRRHQQAGRCGEPHAGRRSRLFFPGLDPDVGTRVGVELAEQAQLDLARKEAILAAGERAGAGLLDVVLGDVADEIAGHAHIEEQLAAATLLVERERLPRAEQVGRRGRRHLRLWICRRWPGRARRRRRGHRRRLRLQPLQPLAQRVDGSLILLLLALELLELLAQRFGVLRGDGRRAERDEERDNEDHECVH